MSNGEAGSTLFFYNRLNGAAAIAETTSKSVRTTKVCAPGELGEWTHVVSCGSGLLFSNRE